MLTKIPHGYDEVRATYGTLQFGSDGRVTRDWERQHLVSTPLPYALANHALPGLKSITRLYCHRLVADHLVAALSEVHRLGLHLKDCGDVRYDGLYASGGCWNVRSIRGRPGKWSLHSWGCAVDFNVRENKLGATVSRMHPEVIAAFKKYGWISGGDFTRRDYQHVQLASGC